MKRYLNHKERNCSRCSKKLSHCSCTSGYLASRNVKHVSKVFRYTRNAQDTPWNCLIYSLKKDNRADVIEFLADELSESIRNTIPDISKYPSNYLVTNIPRRKSAIREYGYDHAKTLAKKVSRKLNVNYVSLLKSKTRKAQKTTFGEGRIKNVKFDYKAFCPKSIKGKRAIIIDDIITTGASISTAARLICNLGAKDISAASVAIAYHDIYKPFMLPYEAKRYIPKSYFNRKRESYIRSM